MKVLNTMYGGIKLDDEDYVRLLKLDDLRINFYSNRFYIKKSKDSGAKSLLGFIMNKQGEAYTYKDGNVFNNQKENIIRGGYNYTRKNKYQGVIKKGVNFEARCMKNGGLLHLGVYKDEIIAAIAYNKAIDTIPECAGFEKNTINISKDLYEKIYSAVGINTLTRRTNQGANQKLRGCSSKYTGVTWDKAEEKWRAALHYKGKRINLGRFDNEIEAAQAYNEAVLHIHGSTGRVNSIPKPLHPVLGLKKLEEILKNWGKEKITSSKYTGVTWDKLKERWRVGITYKRVKLYVGRYKEEVKAAQAYNEVALFLHVDGIKLNQVSKSTLPIVDLDKIRQKLEKKGIKID